MKDIIWYTIMTSSAGPFSTADSKGIWCRRADVEELLGQFPPGMEHCTFSVEECPQGHKRLHATNWIDHGCQVCAESKLKEALEDMTNKAIAAVWLLPEDVGVQQLRELREEARKLFLGEDKRTIAQLQDELASAQEALLHAVRPPLQGVTAVYGLKPNDKAALRYALSLLAINRRPNGGLEVEVQLP